MMRIKRNWVLILVSAALFSVCLPLVSKINFMQNDDWNRVTTVERFMHGDFTLLPVTATTFYTQGFLGTLFAFIFGLGKLPYLTLVFSVLNFLVFSLILRRFFNLSQAGSILVSLILFFNPLHVYSAVGFMTENYTLFFLLCALYFVLRLQESGKTYHLLLSNLFSILAFFCKQNGIILYAATIPYFLFKKRYRECMLQLTSLAAFLTGYYLLFPLTTEMKGKGFILGHLVDSSYSFSLIYGILIVLASFLLPLLLTGVCSLKRRLYWVFLPIASMFLFIFLNQHFAPAKISWEEYPYFENTFERTGFIPRTVHGTKYQFVGNYDLYKYWDTASKICLALFLSGLFITRRRVVNLYSVSIAGYLVLMVFTETFFDRYILALIPFAVLFILHTYEVKATRLFYVIIGVFLLFLAYFSTQLVYDFVYTHNYIWSKSETLVAQGIPFGKISATGAWKRLYGLDLEYEYLFSYDSLEVNKELSRNHVLLNTYVPEYKPDFYTRPAVYLYKRI